MARPRKTGLDYFPHDCKLNAKVAMLELAHGNDGYTVFFKCLEDAYQTETGELDFSGVLRRRMFAKRANISEETLIDILDTAAEIELFDKPRWHGEKILTSDGIRKRIAKIEHERINSRGRAGKSSAPKNQGSAPQNSRITGERERERERERETTLVKVEEPPLPDSNFDKELLKYFDADAQDLSTGRCPLKNFPNVWLRLDELRDAREQFSKAGLSKDDWRDAMKRANAQLEGKKHQITFKGGMAYSYLTGHILLEAINTKAAANRLNGVRQAPAVAEPTRKAAAKVLNAVGLKTEAQ